MERFAAKKDGWLGAVFFVGVAGMAVFCVTLSRAPGPIPARAALVVAGAVVAALLLWIWFGTWYELDASELRVRCGPFRWRVTLASILEARPRTGLSGPILSTDAVFLRTDRGLSRGITVAPARREEFLAALAAGAGLVDGGAGGLYRTGHRSG